MKIIEQKLRVIIRKILKEESHQELEHYDSLGNEFKVLLTEWNNVLNNNLILEIRKNEVIDVIGEDDYNILVKSNKKASQDQNFLQVIINTYKSNQNHAIEDILGLYQNYTRFISPSWNRGEEAKIDVPGGHRASLSLKDLKDKKITYDDIAKFIEASSSMILKSKVYIKCLKQGPVNPDFEVIINDSDWIICYPKTIKGSISLARSFWNGRELEYDKSVSGGAGRYIGKMNWCTSVVSGINMFLNYHRKMNLHMYYCIKKNMNVEDPDRKLCISFAKKNNKVSLHKKKNCSVDGNNSPTSEEDFRSYIGKRFDVLFEDAEKSSRLEIDEKAYYESISLAQYKALRFANEDDLQTFIYELDRILKYSRDKNNILKLGAKDNSLDIRRIIASRSELLEADTSGSIIRALSKDENENVRASIAYREDLLKVDPSGELIKQLAKDESESVRASIAYREDLLKVDPSGELIKQLIKDESESVRAAIAESKDLLKVDPSGELIKQLIKKLNDHDIAETICKNYDLLKLDPTGKLIRQLIKRNKHALQIITMYQNLLKLDPTGKLIRQLAFDKNINIRWNISTYQDLLGADPTGKLIRQLANDESESIRGAIAGHKDLLKLDPSGEITRQLANDESGTVRGAIAGHKDLLKLDPSGEVIKKLSNDDDWFVRTNIASRKDLLKIDPSGEIIKKLSQDSANSVKEVINSIYDLSKLQINTNESIIREYIKYFL